MGRGALRVRADSPAGPLDVVTCHLKSKLITFPGGRFSTTDEDERARFAAFALYRRTAEATTLRNYANTLLAGRGDMARMIVLGDFNDEPTAATTQILQGPTGSEIATGGEFIPDQGDRWRLLNLAPLLPSGSASRVFHGRGELIDNIFVSTTLRPAVQSVSVVASGPLPSITETASARRNSPVSDHAMVMAALDLD